MLAIPKNVILLISFQIKLAQSRVNTLLLFVLALSMASYAEDKPTPLFTAKYKGKHSGIPVTITRTLQKTSKPQEYIFKLTAEGFPGTITEESQFQIDNKQFIPHSYNYKQKLFGISKTKDVFFDWQNETAIYKKNGKKQKNHALEQGMLDQSLYQLALIQDLNAYQKEFAYTFVKKNDIKTIKFNIIDKNSTYYVNEKPFKTWKLQVERDKSKNKNTIITVIPELFFHIAEIVQTESNGKTYSVSLKEISFAPEYTAFANSSHSTK